MRTYSPPPGEHINHCAAAMIAMAVQWNESIDATFNDIPLRAEATTTVNDLVGAYNQERERRHKEWLASPAGQESERRRVESQRLADEARAEGIKPFEIADHDGWAKCVEANTDPYGACCVRYAARWANLMDAEIELGASVRDIAEKTSHDADSEGITGFMYGAAVSMLAQCWKHGEELRRWHNLSTQIGNEGETANDSGGVLNPAILKVG